MQVSASVVVELSGLLSGPGAKAQENQHHTFRQFSLALPDVKSIGARYPLLPRKAFFIGSRALLVGAHGAESGGSRVGTGGGDWGLVELGGFGSWIFRSRRRGDSLASRDGPAEESLVALDIHGHART